VIPASGPQLALRAPVFLQEVAHVLHQPELLELVLDGRRTRVVEAAGDLLDE
jgi:hypothetical protein